MAKNVYKQSKFADFIVAAGNKPFRYFVKYVNAALSGNDADAVQGFEQLAVAMKLPDTCTNGVLARIQEQVHNENYKIPLNYLLNEVHTYSIDVYFTETNPLMNSGTAYHVTIPMLGISKTHVEGEEYALDAFVGSKIRSVTTLENELAGKLTEIECNTLAKLKNDDRNIQIVALLNEHLICRVNYKNTDYSI